ncbi:MAG: signal peptidase I [Fimbriimonadaceae bacterium]
MLPWLAPLQDSLFNLFAQQSDQGMAYTIDKIARMPISKILIFATVLTFIRLALHNYIVKTPIHLRTGGYNAARILNDISDALVYAAIVVFLIVRPFGIQTFHIPSPSMVNTLKVGDYIVANKFVYRAGDPKAGDIVVFKPPPRGVDPRNPSSDFIKRCLGTPGQVVEMKSFQLYRDGKAITEPYKTISDNDQGYLVPEPDETEKQNAIDNQPNFKLVEWTFEDGHQETIPVLSDQNGEFFATYQEIAFNNADVQAKLRELPAAPVPKGYYLMIGDNRNGSNDGRYWGLVPRENIIGRAEFIWLPLSRMSSVRKSAEVKN